jgi:ATP-binding cassette subfamily B protein
LAGGILFIVISNYFAILAPQVTAYVVDKVQQMLPGAVPRPITRQTDPLVNWFLGQIDGLSDFGWIVAICCLTILGLAVIRGIFMFLMRQTIVVMSRHIEFDQKNEVFAHYQKLDTQFFKTHSTGDLMNRIAEDVSRVRMYTGPAIMYLVNLVTTIFFAVYNMWGKNAELTLYVLAPLPILAFTIYRVNTTIHKKSERIQQLQSDLTTNAQQSYSGIRVIKSYLQENAMLGFFDRNSEEYRRHAISLARVEALYYPSITFLIGLSTLLTIMIGGLYYLSGKLNEVGTLVEFILYINMLTFPVSAIGWVAGMIQRAAASQKRLNEFLQAKPEIASAPNARPAILQGEIEFRQVTFTYPHTGIKAMRHFNLHIAPGQRVAIVGKTGSGKSTVAQLLLRMYDPTEGALLLDGRDVRTMALADVRRQISYVPQDVFLFSETVENNIRFGNEDAGEHDVVQAAQMASVAGEINSFAQQYQTMVGERGVTLSGGQKQRISIARALLKNAPIIVFDDCLSAVDAKTEQEVLNQLNTYLQGKTAIVITHRIFSLLQFDQILVLQDGHIVEQGTHAELLALNGTYAELYRMQQLEEEV